MMKENMIDYFNELMEGNAKKKHTFYLGEDK